MSFACSAAPAPEPDQDLESWLAARAEQRITVLVDVADDIAVERALRLRAHRAGRVLVSPGPAATSGRSLHLHILAALGHGRRLRPPDEAHPSADAVGWWSAPRRARQQDPSPDVTRYVRRGTFPAVGVGTAEEALRRSGARELCVLRSQEIPAEGWLNLAGVSLRAGARLVLVVSGRPPTPAQLQVLAPGRVRVREVPNGRAGGGAAALAVPWWSRPSYQRGGEGWGAAPAMVAWVRPRLDHRRAAPGDATTAVGVGCRVLSPASTLGCDTV